MQKNYYPFRVEFTEDVFGEESPLKSILQEVTGGETPRVFLVSDANFVYHTEGIGSKIGRYFKESGITLASKPVIIQGGEKIKADNMHTVNIVLKAIMEAHIGKDDVILAVGGGAFLDVVGFAAAMARGGVPVVRIPTTPGAMMEAAFADNAALDLCGIKDGVRVPSIPAAVVIQVSFALTILDGVWRGSASEAVRAAISHDAKLLKKLIDSADDFSARDLSVLEETVRLVVASKLKKGPSEIGEWASQRLQTLSNYRLPHGYSIAMGTAIDIKYAEKKGDMKAEDAEKIIKLLLKYGALDGMDHSHHLISQIDRVLAGLESWRLAKGKSSFELPEGIGSTKKNAEVDPEIMRVALKEFFEVAKTA